MVQIGLIGPDQSRLVQIGIDWSRLVEIGQHWSKLVENGRDWSRLVEIGRGWFAKYKFVSDTDTDAMILPLKSSRAHKGEHNLNPLLIDLHIYIFSTLYSGLRKEGRKCGLCRQLGHKRDRCPNSDLNSDWKSLLE